MDKLVYLIYPVMILILLYGCKISGKNQWNDELMSLKQTKYWQGFIALCIMLHHIGQETCASWQMYELYPGLEFFVPIGYFLVAFFMMCSGFGLYKSYKAKENYLNGFIRKRICPLIVGFYISGWIFFICRIIMKEPMNGWKIFCYISGWGLPNLYGWFVVAMPFFYLCFYLSFKYFKKEWMKIAGTVFGVFAYTLLGTMINHNNYWMRGEWWYNCVHLFWIGILFAKYEAAIVKSLQKKYILKLILCVVLTYVFFVVSEIATGTVSYYGQYNPMLSFPQVVLNRWICLLTQMLGSFFFVLSIVMISMKVKIGNRFLGFMGSITLEFYLIHGLFLEFFSYEFCEVVPSIVRITNVALLILVVFVLAVPASVILQKIIKRICHVKG